ncbi:AAA family ATPase [Virgibacillus halophilus]|uniref:AAA family ATPase n=1 Tax=Tigheibacillus halophilus TaxID=361280 RepID=A0ABU5CAG8_9BACI|nr:AAA family ATPase [Virgibacillus halophilus]
MFLKKLESVGFKSFAERIDVAFVPGVTAVVGPNGSGKSNITDAIRWVLGEQSAKSLRGSKMEDIIFQGSDSRKKLNVAEVTLLLDNTENHLPIDYDEVSVTRRVYRSGESEFYINKQVCRLKDIVDLFMDSGLGREAFSIISQGKVEEILSSKAVERRAIFEEAAGVLKYKQRKKKAEFKLAETKENLNRVEDIMHEINNQIEPLEEQAEKAEKYLTYKADLKEKEVSLLVTIIDKLHGKYEALKNEIEQEKLEEIEMQTSIQQKQAQLEKSRQDVQRQDEQIEQVQSQLVETIQTLEHFSGKKQVLKERIKHFAENKEKLDKQKNDISNRIEQTSTLLQRDKKKLRALKTSRKETSARLQELEETMSLKEEKLAEQIDDLKSQYIEYLNEQAAKHNEQQTIKQQQGQISRKKRETDRTISTFAGTEKDVAR